MIGDMLLPSFLMPLALMLIATGVSLRLTWAPAAGALAAILVAFGWIQGFRFGQLLNPTAMDGLWLMTLVAVVSACLNRKAAALLMLLGLPISVWAVWVFASSIGPMEWVGHTLALLVPVAMVAYGSDGSEGPPEAAPFWMPAFLVAPVAVLAPTIGLAGSIKLAEIGGAIGVVMAMCWLVARGAPLIAGWQTTRLWRRLLSTLTLPLVWVALAGYHLVGVPVLALLAAALPWLVGSLFRTRLTASHWWFQLIVLVAVTVLPLAFSLWYVWPEQSLY